MRKKQGQSRRRAVAIAILGVLALFGFGILAALPSTGAELRTVFAVLGYVSFLFLFRAAMRRRREDWDVLWNGERIRPGARVSFLSDHGSRSIGRSAALAGLIAAVPVASLAQQTLFNVPSADVLDKGKGYFEADALWRPTDPNFAVFTGRGVYGLGSHVEAGVNFGGFTTPGRSTPIATPNVKWQPWSSGPWSATAGAFGLFFLRGSRDGNPAALGYGDVACKLTTGTRVTAGGYWASSGYAAADVQKGALVGFEQKLNDHWNIDADWFSGQNSLGYFSPGVVSSWGPWTIYAAYSFKNGDSKGNALLFELGFNF